MNDEAGSMPWFGPSNFDLGMLRNTCKCYDHFKCNQYGIAKSATCHLALINFSSTCGTGCCKGHAGFDARDERGAYPLCPAYLQSDHFHTSFYHIHKFSCQVFDKTHMLNSSREFWFRWVDRWARWYAEAAEWQICF